MDVIECIAPDDPPGTTSPGTSCGATATAPASTIKMAAVPHVAVRRQRSVFSRAISAATSATALETWLDEARRSGIALMTVELPGYAQLAAAQETIQSYQSARSLARELEAHRDGLSPALQEALAAGAKLSGSALEASLRTASDLGPPLVGRLSEIRRRAHSELTGVPPVGSTSPATRSSAGSGR